jgi:hypothetical protein
LPELWVNLLIGLIIDIAIVAVTKAITRSVRPQNWFSSTHGLTWKIPKEKEETAVRQVREMPCSYRVLLEELQSSIGRLNDLCIMCPFLKIFQFNENREVP